MATKKKAAKKSTARSQGFGPTLYHIEVRPDWERFHTKRYVNEELDRPGSGYWFLPDFILKHKRNLTLRDGDIESEDRWSMIFTPRKKDPLSKAKGACPHLDDYQVATSKNTIPEDLYYNQYGGYELLGLKGKPYNVVTTLSPEEFEKALIPHLNRETKLAFEGACLEEFEVDIPEEIGYSPLTKEALEALKKNKASFFKPKIKWVK